MSAKVAVVGAGAMGVVTGHHLHLSGAEVTFVVRPSRAREMPGAYRAAPQIELVQTGAGVPRDHTFASSRRLVG